MATNLIDKILKLRKINDTKIKATLTNLFSYINKEGWYASLIYSALNYRADSAWNSMISMLVV